MDLELQKRAPLLEALQEFRRMRVVPFDVPGHKRGKGNPELLSFLGRQCLEIDVNSMKPLDNLCHPTSVIKEAEAIAADAFGTASCYFMVGGTTSSVQSMILTVCKEGDKIIMPRNVHRSAINALILCGAEPIYINPQTDERLGISLGMETADVVKAIQNNPDAAAVLVNNPTYYGVVSDLKRIIDAAHLQNMKVLVDEAHGTHFYFGEDMPVSAMSLGADMASVSMHKSGGSLTQSSILLCGENINTDYVRQIINLTQTTSASYLLLSSLDIARRNLALHGRETFKHVNELAEYARSEINCIGDYYAYSRELTLRSAVYDFDTTKLSVNTYEIGLAGIEVYDILRDEFDIQVEFGDLSNILAYISLGDREQDIERLVAALAEIRRKYKKSRANLQRYEYINPIVALTPKQAFYSVKKSIPLENCAGEICAEFVMCYPPGIPILAPGERITGDIIDYIKYAKEKGCLMTGPEDMEINNINVCGGDK
ncbi:MAG: aminotransferase class I/II-fold pyridoxal phosphate-dependent enzyme [Oscillospiraceae bacterium]|nr:aminotransferase class I/II-fold pyridoxal phosphate-dependent enzyme [Oscillospiraceae bacterium]